MALWVAVMVVPLKTAGSTVDVPQPVRDSPMKSDVLNSEDHLKMWYVSYLYFVMEINIF